MNEENSAAQKDPMQECAAQLGSAAQALERVIGKLEAQYEALNQKIDRIIATVEKPAAEKSGEAGLAASAQAEQVRNSDSSKKRIVNCGSARDAKRWFRW